MNSSFRLVGRAADEGKKVLLVWGEVKASLEESRRIGACLWSGAEGGGLGTGGGGGGGSEGECPALAMGEGGEGLGLQWVVLLLLKDARPDGELELGDLLLYRGVDRSEGVLRSVGLLGL